MGVFVRRMAAWVGVTVGVTVGVSVMSVTGGAGAGVLALRTTNATPANAVHTTTPAMSGHILPIDCIDIDCIVVYTWYIRIHN